MYMANARHNAKGPNANYIPLAGVGGFSEILAFALGETQILAFLDTNMLVSPTQNSRVGDIAQRDGPTQMFLRRSGI